MVEMPPKISKERYRLMDLASLPLTHCQYHARATAEVHVSEEDSRVLHGTKIKLRCPSPPRQRPRPRQAASPASGGGF